MFLPDITLDTTKVYSLVTQRALSSVRSNAAQPLTEPNTLSISHENANNGRRSSVVIFDDTKVVVTAGELPITDVVRVLFKVQFNPFSGRTTTAEDIAQLIVELSDFLSVPANMTKLLNAES
jgi:hypothetical protein